MTTEAVSYRRELQECLPRAKIEEHQLQALCEQLPLDVGNAANDPVAAMAEKPIQSTGRP